MKDMPENYLSILNYLSTVLDNLPEQVVLLGVDGGVYRLLIANAAFAKAMGEHNLAQHPTFEQLLDAAAYRRFQTEAAKTTETHTIQTFRHDESDGSTSCITYLPILDALGEVNGLVLLISDSTEAERQHRLIEHLIASLATWRETPGELLLELDANGVVTFCSQEIVKRFGYPAEAWVGQPLTKMISCTGEAGHVRGRTTRCEGTVKDATGTAVTVQCEIWRVGDNLPSGPAGVRLTII